MHGDFNTSFIVATTTAALAILLVYIWFRQRYTYWQRHNIAYVKPTTPFGNLGNLFFFNYSFGDFFRELYNAHSNEDLPVVGVYWMHQPALILRQPDLIRNIMIKDSNMFLNRYEGADALHDSFGSFTLPLSKYPIWRESRKRMSEFFTSGQLKQRMYPLMLGVCSELETHIAKHFKAHETVAKIEVKHMCSLFTTDITALVAFSIQAGSLQGNLKTRHALNELLRPSFIKIIHFLVLFFLPHWSRWIKAKVFPLGYIKFIHKMLADIIKQRKNCDINGNKTNHIYNDDFIDLILKFQEESSLDFVHHPEFLASNAGIILLAGFETSSSTIAFILYELAKQPAIQQKLRTELCAHFAADDGTRKSLTYEELQKLSYLEMVLAEGLRKYPAASFINRECTPPLHQTGYSLKPFVDFEVPRDMPVYVSILGIHRDEKYWPNPDHFDPERFQADRMKTMHPMAYIPFGAGQHSCIGTRLGILQIKLGLVHILKDYSVSLCENSPKSISFEPKSFMLQSIGGIELKFIKETPKISVK